MQKMPLIIGVLNATPDSFSDGGLFVNPDEAFRRSAQMIEEGADIIDVGGESSRPGAEPVALQEELDRTIPIIEGLARRFDIRLSIDTYKFEVAQEAVRAGATIVNDITGGHDIRMVELGRDPDIAFILMHMKGSPRTMQDAPHYDHGVVDEVKNFLENRVRLFQEAGVLLENLWVDPGIGFGKTYDQNLLLLNSLREFSEIGGRLAIGTSRKSFLSQILGKTGASFEEREAGTVASNLWAFSQGATLFRVHEVGQLKRAVLTWSAMEKASQLYLPYFR